jgi:hypothetical protein
MIVPQKLYDTSKTFIVSLAAYFLSFKNEALDDYILHIKDLGYRCALLI